MGTCIDDNQRGQCKTLLLQGGILPFLCLSQRFQEDNTAANSQQPEFNGHEQPPYAPTDAG